MELPRTPEEITLWKLKSDDHNGEEMFIYNGFITCRTDELILLKWIYYCQRTMPELCSIIKTIDDPGVKRCSITIGGIFILSADFIRRLTKNDITEEDRKISELLRLINFYATSKSV